MRIKFLTISGILLLLSPALLLAQPSPQEKETMGEWIERKMGGGKDLIYSDQPALVDEAQVFQDNSGKGSADNPALREPLSHPKPEFIDEGGLVDKNVGLIDWVTEDPKPDQIDEKSLVEKNVGMIGWVTEDPKPNQINEGGLVEKNVGMIGWVTENPKPGQIDEQGLVEKNVGMIEPVSGNPKPDQIDEGGLVEKNIGLSQSISEKKATLLDDEDLASENIPGLDLGGNRNPTSSAFSANPSGMIQNSVSKSAAGAQVNTPNISGITSDAVQKSTDAVNMRPNVGNITGGLFK